MNIHYFQYVPFEGLGSIEQWAQKRGHQLSAIRFYEGGSYIQSADEILSDSALFESSNKMMDSILDCLVR